MILFCSSLFRKLSCFIAQLEFVAVVFIVCSW